MWVNVGKIEITDIKVTAFRYRKFIPRAYFQGRKRKTDKTHTDYY